MCGKDKIVVVEHIKYFVVWKESVYVISKITVRGKLNNLCISIRVLLYTLSSFEFYSLKKKFAACSFYNISFTQ